MAVITVTVTVTVMVMVMVMVVAVPAVAPLYVLMTLAPPELVPFLQ